MDPSEFAGFLQHRFRGMIHFSFSREILEQYPCITHNIFNKWQELEQSGTAEYKFRLNFQEMDPTDEFICGMIQNSLPHIDTCTDPSNRDYFIEWYRFLIQKVFIPTNPDNWLEFFYTDVPLCYVHVSTRQETVPRVGPKWMMDLIADVPAHNLIVDAHGRPNSKANPAVINDDSQASLNDFLVKISHSVACKRLKEQKAQVEEFVKTYWTGIKNSIMRFVGIWGRTAKVSREETVKQLKRLGDLCVAAGEYKEAFDYYQQLYQELGDNDPPVNDSLCMMFAITSLLTTDELDVFALLKPVIMNPESKERRFVYLMVLLVAISYSTSHLKPSITARLYVFLINALRSSDICFSRIAPPVMREAMSLIMDRRHAALILYIAASEYKQLGMHYNALIGFWRAYKHIWGNCWPRIAHALLLEISTLAEPPSNLLHMLSHKSLQFVPQTVEQLKRMDIKEMIYMESVIVHDLIVHTTGFPHSPPPPMLSKVEWAKLRRLLFPVLHHPSTEEFAAEMWTSESEITKYKCAVGEEYSIDFKISTTLPEGCEMSDIQLFLEPSGMVDTDIVKQFKLYGTKQMTFKFTPTKPGKFKIKGIRFTWFDVAPVAVNFQEQLNYQAVDNASLMSLHIRPHTDTAYVGLPFKVNALLHKVIGQISSIFTFIETYPPNCATVDIAGLKKTGFLNRFNLDPTPASHDITFEIVPETSGMLEFHMFVAYSDTSRSVRFVEQRFSVESRDMKKVHCVSGSDSITLQPDDKTYAVECKCAVVEHQDSTVRFVDVVEDYNEKKCSITVRRTFLDSTVTNVLQISPVFVTFGERSYKVAQFPCDIDIIMDVLCIGGNTGELRLAQPGLVSGAIQCAWIGKNRFVLNGPKKIRISAKLLVMGPCSIDVGALTKLQYGSAKPTYHHRITISL